MNREWNSKRKDSLLHSSVPALPGSTNLTGCYDMTWCTKRSVSYLSLDSWVLRTSLNTSEMPELLIVITDIWLIWFFKWICVLDSNIWIKLSKITARSSVSRKGQMYRYSKPWSAMQRLAGGKTATQWHHIIKKDAWRKTWQISGPLYGNSQANKTAYMYIDINR